MRCTRLLDCPRQNTSLGPAIDRASYLSREISLLSLSPPFCSSLSLLFYHPPFALCDRILSAIIMVAAENALYRRNNMWISEDNARASSIIRDDRSDKQRIAIV
jgi:hypothetical protein